MGSIDHNQTFHDGERALQSQAGTRTRLEAVEHQLVRHYMPDQHRAFFSARPFILIGSVDEVGQPWASVLSNPPGFISAPDALHLVVEALPAASDPLEKTLKIGADVGLLGIEFHTRRRNRVNGRVVQLNETGFTLEVKQSFGNCPRYIHPREIEYRKGIQESQHYEGQTLTLAVRGMIERADTLFIASAHPQANGSSAAAHGADVSHRGGAPRFVHIDANDTLVIPDYQGNGFFNTLGNLTLNPRAALVFIEFETGDVLHITVSAQLQTEGAELAAFDSAERLLRLRVKLIRHTTAAVPLRIRQHSRVNAD